MTRESQTSSNVSVPATVGEIKVAFWNLQNLFDIEASKLASDLEFTAVNGWDRRAFEMRIDHLAEVIRLMFDGNGPDLLGICEVENERVANRLIKAIGRDDYALAHIEHPDIHGLDTSLIYSTKCFDFDESRTLGHLVCLQYPTRDIFEVHLKVRANDSHLVVMVNHWPSRRQGRLETEPFRLTVASHCRRLVEKNVKLCRKEYLKLQDTDASLQQLNNAWDSNVLIMGDLNDEPWNRSVMETLGAGFTTDHLGESIRFSGGCLPSYRSYAAQSAWLFNPMWSLVSQPDQGTHYSSRATQTMGMPDQFLLSRGLYFGSRGLQAKQGSPGIPEVQIFRPDIMRTPKGRPHPFSCENRMGYSDHFPITAALNVLEK